ncbi:hypothetical protein BH23GEM10_BH23GEM10_02150 [soil metagenome]
MVRRMTVVALLLQLAGCSTFGGMTNRSALQRSVGLASLHDVMEKSDKVMLRHQFQIVRRDINKHVYIETHWRDRVPFADEASGGVVTAQTRVIITARPRTSTALGQIYTVGMRIENRVMHAFDSAWSLTAPTSDYRAWATGIATELRSELDVGVRVF